MNDLPYLDHGVETPAEQQVSPGKSADYVAVEVVRGTDSWIVVETVRRHLAFGRVEQWCPVFECVVPAELRSALGSAVGGERYFNIWFRGTPSEKGQYGHDGLCLREVRIAEIYDAREGRLRPKER